MIGRGPEWSEMCHRQKWERICCKIKSILSWSILRTYGARHEYIKLHCATCSTLRIPLCALWHLSCACTWHVRAHCVHLCVHLCVRVCTPMCAHLHMLVRPHEPRCAPLCAQRHTCACASTRVFNCVCAHVGRARAHVLVRFYVRTKMYMHGIEFCSLTSATVRRVRWASSRDDPDPEREALNELPERNKWANNERWPALHGNEPQPSGSQHLISTVE